MYLTSISDHTYNILKKLKVFCFWFIQATKFIVTWPIYLCYGVKWKRRLNWQYGFNNTFKRAQVLRNVTGRFRSKGKPRALIPYIISPFLEDQDNEKMVYHTNKWRAKEIASILDELGYIVDVMLYSDFSSKIDLNYDLLLGFGVAEKLATLMPKDSIKIRLATGCEANFHNQREGERIDQVNKRRGCRLSPIRKNTDDSSFLKYFNAIACLGNEVTAETFRPFFNRKILCFNNHGYDHLSGMLDDKDFNFSKKNFLFFGSIGQVLFGLDLLLEIFSKKPDLNLYVCGPYEKERDFVDCYHKELYETPNIIPVGWVVVGSNKYRELVSTCGSVILPICSSASAGSVITCMANGLLPIVSKWASINTQDFGITFDSLDIETIEKNIDWVSSQPSDWHKEVLYKVLKNYRLNFSQASFSKRFREILESIVKEKIEHRKKQNEEDRVI